MEGDFSEYENSVYKFNQLIDSQTEKDDYFGDEQSLPQISDEKSISNYQNNNNFVDDNLVNKSSFLEEKSISSMSFNMSLPESIHKKRDIKEIVKRSESNQSQKDKQRLQKLEARKKQNRVAAQK